MLFDSLYPTEYYESSYIIDYEKLYEKGANIFVSGTSSLFMNSEKSMKEIIAEKRKVIGWE